MKIFLPYVKYAGLVNFLILPLIFLCNLTEAADTKPVAMVEFSCKSGKAARPEEEQEATLAVKRALIEKYIASVPDERKLVLSEKKDDLFAEPDRCLSNFVIRDEDFNKETKMLTLSAQADINTAFIDGFIDGPVTKNLEHSQIVFIFVARRQAEVESRGPKVTTGTQQISGKEAQAEGSGGSASETVKTSEAVTSVSSETRTADRITYVLDDNSKADIDSTISGVLINRGFDVVSAANLVAASNGQFNPDELQTDFKTSSQFSLKHQIMATRVCREAGAPLLAYGTLTIGVKRTDPVNSRNTLVDVDIDAQVFDCRKPLASKVGSIGALQVEGVGADQTQAETEAIKLAAEKAATTLADQLHNRGIR
jgi:hypothetical protein